MSKFDKIFEAREADTEESVGISDSKPTSKKDTNGSTPKKNNVRSKSPAKKNSDAETPASKNRPVNSVGLGTAAKRGRPPAKRSDPDFVGLTTYIRRKTHLKAKIALLQEGENRELSELVEDLIAGWLNRK